MKHTILRKLLFFRKNESYRTPMQVTHLFLHPKGGSFPICPRCDTPFEREYQAYCADCGQCLGWDTYTKIIEENHA